MRLGTAWCREVETKAPTKPIRELDAGSAHCGTKFSRKRAQPEASDLRENVNPRFAETNNAIGRGIMPPVG